MNETEKVTNLAVGTRIRQARIMLGLSQQQLATQLNITFQQVQKYEKGTNNVNASRLLDSYAGDPWLSVHDWQR